MYHLRDVPWEDTFKLSSSVAASEICEWLQVGTDVCIPHHKYQVKHYLFPWFSAACAAIVHKNHFFHLYQQNKCSEFKVKFRQASNHFKRVIEALKLPYAVVYKLGVLGHFLSCGILGLRSIRTFWAQKIRQGKLLKFLL